MCFNKNELRFKIFDQTKKIKNMGCNCQNQTGYNKALQDAKSYEKRMGKKSAFFRQGDIFSFTDLESIKKVKGICCYFTTDEVEHKVPKPKRNKTKQE